MRTSQTIEKFAFIHRQAYSDKNLRGVEKPLYKNLINNIFSSRGGEKASNQGIERLSGRFSGLAKGLGSSLFLASSLSFATPAYAADDAAKPTTVQTAAVSNSPYIIDASDYSRGEMSLKDALAASKNYDAVIYHGKNILDADRLARTNKLEDNYNVVSISGLHNEGAAVIFINGKAEKGSYSQDDLDGGKLGVALTQAIGNNNKKVASLTSSSPTPDLN